ncbi:MAG: DUF1127 domain-containing protein [Inquilinaceae bacterium]
MAWFGSLFTRRHSSTRNRIGPVFFSVPRAVVHTLSRWNDRRRQRRALRRLDDRLLADIGKSREDARREASTPFWRR